MKLKSKIRNIFLWSLVSLVCIALLTFLIDPLQQYRKADFYKVIYANPQYLNPGLAKTYEYDTIIIGSSMSENFTLSYVDKKLGVKTLKLTLPGASANDEKNMLETALRHHKDLKNVIFGLDVYSFCGDPETSAFGKETFPYYLYDDNLWNDYRYLLNFDIMLGMYSRIVLANIFGHNKQVLDYDKMWWSGDSPYSKEKTLQDWKHKNIFTKRNDATYDVSVLIRSFNFNFLKLLEENRDINFYIFYPPYSILTYKKMENQDWLKDVIAFKNYIFKVTKNMKHVRIYDFWRDRDTIYNLDNYKDIGHYAPYINDRIIDKISQDIFLVNEKNIDRNNEVILQQVRDFNLSQLK